jgi:hypothetical protein
VDLTQRARELLEGADELAASLVDVVWEHLPGYEPTRLDRADLAAVVGPNLQATLRAVAENRRPSGDELSVARTLGERRAVQGVPIEGVVASWHAAERVLLARLLGGSTAVRPEELRTASRRLAVAIDAMVDASIQAHRETRAEMGSHLEHVETDLITRLTAGEPLDPTYVEERARLIGAEPQRPHCALAAALTGSDPVQLGRAHRTLVDHVRQHVEGRILSGTHEGAVLVVFADSEDLSAHLQRAVARSEMPPGLVVGLGDPRPRLGEAAGSCREALAALRVGLRRGAGRSLVVYRRVIPEVLLEQNPLTSRKLVASTLGPLLGHPALLETLSAYVDNGLSVRRTAEALTVHENTIAYRLRRLTQLLGAEAPTELARLDVLMSLRALKLLPTTPEPSEVT